MKIAVCIKQVPVLSRVRFDYESKTIVREGVPLEVNSFDLLAVDRAVELGKQTGADVVVFTMGPSQAREALIQCLAMGAHRAVHLTDRAMAGSDTLATARTLALALQREGFNFHPGEGPGAGGLGYLLRQEQHRCRDRPGWTRDRRIASRPSRQ